MTGESAAPAEMPGVEEIARVLCEARHQMPVSPDQWAAEVAHIKAMEVKHPTYITGFSTGTDAMRQARAILALFAPILAEKDGYKEIVRQAAAARDAAGYIGAVWDCIDDLSARALAAEAALAELRKQMLADEGQHRDALAAERERLLALVEDACAIPPADFAGMELEAFHRGADAMNNAIAAAIRAQGVG